MFLEGKIYEVEYIVSEAIYAAFKDAYLDYNPIHIDPLVAQSKGFPDKVMYGNILNGFLSHFIGEVLESKEVIIISQKINYHSPFFINDKLSFKATLTQIHTCVGMIDFKYQFRNTQKKLIAKGNIQIKTI